MFTYCTWLLVCCALQAPPAPVAKVMVVQGNITLLRDGKSQGQLTLTQELFDKDQLQLEPKAGLILDFRGGFREHLGLKEKLPQKTVLTIGAAGCEPAKAVEHLPLKTYTGQFTN